MDVGQILNGRYRLADRIGTGGMSVVWRADDEVLGRPVAVKVLAGQFATDPGWHRRIRAEAQAAARLSHPNVTNVFDFGTTDDGDPFVVMELLRGVTLAERLQSGPLAPAAAIRICAEVAAGLAAAHAEQLVHRDVKPANVVLTPGAAKLVDFGIVGVTGDPDNPDPNDPVLGTPAYLAPERLAGEEITPASDVYAFGLLLYRCLTGRLPWDSETTTQMVINHVTAPPDPLPSVDGVPEDVRALCMRCLTKAPAVRPSAAEVAEALAVAAGILPPLDLAAVPVAAEPPLNVAAPPAGAGEATDLVDVAAPPAAAEAGESTELVGVVGAVSGPVAPAQRRRARAGLAVVVAVAALLVTFVLNRPTAGPQASAETARPAPTGSPSPGDTASTGASADPATASSPATTETPAGSEGGQGAGAPAAGAGNPGGGSGQGNTNGNNSGGGTGSGPGTGNGGGGNTGGPGGGSGGGPGTGGGQPGGGPGTGPAIRLTTLGGVIVAACVGQQVNVTDAAPLPGGKLIKAEQGVRDKSRVEFENLGVKVRFEVRCVAGLPVATPK